MQPDTVENVIRERIAAAPGHMLSFAEVMELALYHPEHGYYGCGPRRIGRDGDFYTAVSVGPLYGCLLARLATDIWRSLGEPGHFTIIEQGAHDGQLMEDVALGLRATGSPVADSVRFVIVQSGDAYRSAQSARLVPLLGDRISWCENVAALHERPGDALFITNELLDAFPVHRVRWNGDEWLEQMVALSDEGTGLVWKDAPVTIDRVKEEVRLLPSDLPPGYTTEVHPATVAWVGAVGALPFRGAVLIADYGFEDHEYYSPARSDGTIRRYRGHQMDGEVLLDLGACDLTAHINFSRIVEAAGAHFPSRRCMDQGRFLTRLAAPWLRSLEGRPPSAGDAALLRQLHTLTHPAHMGAKFRMCLLGRGLSTEVVGDA